MKTLFTLIISLFSILHTSAQIFEYIGTEKGLSSRRVLSIGQGSHGYIWILTHKGVDRYDGKDFVHYPLQKEDTSINLYPNLNFLRTDKEQTIWEIGKDGYVFRYNEYKDSFELVFDLRQNYPEIKKEPITCVYMDTDRNFWFCTEQAIYIYQERTRTHCKFNSKAIGKITSITQGEDHTFYFASQLGLFTASYRNRKLQQVSSLQLPFSQLIEYLYYHKESKQLIINTLTSHIYLYHCTSHEVTAIENAMTDIGVNTIITNRQNQEEVLIATDGDGVYKLNMTTRKLTHFLKEDASSPNKMNGSIIKDIIIDSSNRIWTIIYPTGITVYSERYPAYQWISHSANNPNSLVSNYVNGIMEDTDGDIWYATSNGISHYDKKRNQWNNYLHSNPDTPLKENSIFLTLCESRPGIILAGGYMSGIYMIDKKTQSTRFFRHKNKQDGTDKYIRSIFKDSEGMIWSGGFYSLKSYNIQTQEVKTYHIGYPITDIARKDSTSLWIGTINGVYTFDKKKNKVMPFESEIGCVNMIYSPDSSPKAYFGTYGNGLFSIDKKNEETTRYSTDNCGLISNNIYSIVPDKDNNLFLGTENGLSLFNLKENTFTNWTQEQGLQASSFNSKAAVHTRDNKLIFGSNEGAILLSDSIYLPKTFYSKMVFSNLAIMYHTVYPQEKDSPLTQLLDDTSCIRLKYNQNTFSMNVSSINFDNPSNILYSWKLEGFYNHWNQPSSISLIRYTNLSPGTYTLKVRAMLMENHQILEERSIVIEVERPYWLTFGAFLVYISLGIAIVYLILRYQMIRKDRKISMEKINFFMHTAHDIRTPLTLIKAPLGEIMKNEQLSEKGLSNLNMAIQSTDNLSELADNLMNFQKEELYSPTIKVTRQELNAYIQEYLKQFHNYAQQKGITLTYQSDFKTLEVWIDVHKISSILHNLLSNALKYTPKGGNVNIETSHHKNRWTIVIRDTGIGIPKQDQKKLFKFLFRGRNATNQLVTGSGIGMLLTYRLIKKHEGKISFHSTENEGTTFLLSFPIQSKNYVYHKASEHTEQDTNRKIWLRDTHETDSTGRSHAAELPAHASTVMLVDDNHTLRSFLRQSLSDTYHILEASNGKEALEKLKLQHPDLIISDVMMPLMSGEEMCRIVKNDMETSHIPIILLTALGERSDILRGLESKADLYIVKPFDLMVLKANISNILESRDIIRKKFQQPKLSAENDSPEKVNLPTSLDNVFMEKVTQLVKEHLGKDLNVDTLCNGMNMSRTSFYNKIKALTGIPPADFIRNIKMREAAALLASKQYSVAEVSDMMGFADPKYFADTFKKFYGVPPSVYMKQPPNNQ